MDRIPFSINRVCCSSLWKGLSIIWPHVRINLQWLVGNGSDARFWHDPWLRDVGHLFRLVLQDVVSFLGVPSVADMVTSQGDWRWDVLKDLLPQSVLLCILVLKPPQP
ncbi:hypothetical protein V6N13_144214 [Hibiscus sabdariffa]